MKKLLLQFVFILLLNNSVFGQEEYLVQVNPSTCSYTVIDSIPGVGWIALAQSAFDKINHRYVFRGQCFACSNWFLYSIDAANGQTISNPPFPPGGFGNIRFDNSSGILYGWHWIASSSDTYFISINPANFSYTIIDTLNLTGFAGDVMTDEINHHFIFTAFDSIGDFCLFSIDEFTGQVISKPQFPAGSQLKNFAFDNSSGTLYGLWYSNIPNQSDFVSINPTNLNYTVIDTIPYDLSGGLPMGYPTFDEINKRYTFCGMDINNIRTLYTIDATNGQVVYSPQFPAFLTPFNLLETRYDNSSGKLYALHWGPKYIAANVASSDTAFCEKHCLDFFDLSTNNPTSWQWFFPGADSLTSTLQNPTNICYNTYGSFDVTLIACNAIGCDTLILPNFINEYQNPVDSIYISNDTLFSLPAYTYQWYEVTSGIIAGATNQYFIPQQAGSYYCVVSDANGCVGSSGTIVITGINQISNFNFPISVIPNPFNDEITITFQKQNIKEASLVIKNILGQEVYQQSFSKSSFQNNFTIDLSFLPKGIYLLEVVVDGERIIKKLIKQ